MNENKTVENKYTTKLVCVRVNHIRPKYKNLKEWMSDDNNVYIGRKGVVSIKQDDNKVRFPKEHSIFYYPLKISKKLDAKVQIESEIEKYTKYMHDILSKDHVFRIQLISLAGKTLGCICSNPNECHGDALLKLIHYYNRHPLIVFYESLHRLSEENVINYMKTERLYLKEYIDMMIGSFHYITTILDGEHQPDNIFFSDKYKNIMIHLNEYRLNNP